MCFCNSVNRANQAANSTWWKNGSQPAVPITQAQPGIVLPAPQPISLQAVPVKK
ncbi:hypothetical protein [Paenibacillus sp. UMB4589-SE434]|uniref:hypothetical protein n=1 Tax=Paenibacillus sp. UMB4589-SE434 TaxID=3046314 RepID=UPI00254F71BA|nr:hypothetical protein [Paenibacillus sp. UMB4589-SE434]